MTEEWVMFADGFYAVSSFGRVRRERDGHGGAYAGRILKPTTTKVGYPQVVAVPDGAPRRTSYVHHLVAAAFLGPRPKGAVLNHKDGNKTNNHVQNLEYVTVAENNAHAYKAGLRSGCHIPVRVGTERPNAKLDDRQIREIRALAEKGVVRRVIAEAFGVSPSLIDGIVWRTRWRHVS